jgi:hypothetical protein
MGYELTVSRLTCSRLPIGFLQDLNKRYPEDIRFSWEPR